jgi:hypothetical protein
MDQIKMRPPTPVYKSDFTRFDMDKEDGPEKSKADHAQRDQRRRAIILLQILVRGRATQNMMFVHPLRNLGFPPQVALGLKDDPIT